MLCSFDKGPEHLFDDMLPVIDQFYSPRDPPNQLHQDPPNASKLTSMETGILTAFIVGNTSRP
jgi:hypothetical protein